MVESTPKKCNWLFSRTAVIVTCIVSVLAVLVYTGHGPHILAFLPYLLFLACPLMHLFMHNHHGRHEAGNASDEKGKHDGCH